MVFVIYSFRCLVSQSSTTQLLYFVPLHFRPARHSTRPPTNYNPQSRPSRVISPLQTRLLTHSLFPSGRIRPRLTRVPSWSFRRRESVLTVSQGTLSVTRGPLLSPPHPSRPMSPSVYGGTSNLE